MKLIIDSDPGIDDVWAFLLALASPNVELKLISLCFGNCAIKDSLRNTVSLFHVLRLEEEFRRSKGLKPFAAHHPLPIVAVGLEHALDGTKLDATYYHGKDGLGNVHELAPQFTETRDYEGWFGRKGGVRVSDEAITEIPATLPSELGFQPTARPSYEVMLDILRKEEPGTVTICAIGPLMNIAKAAELDAETFSRVKTVVVMGGTLGEPGNVTPGAEFNVYADPEAAARLFALTAKTPSVTLPAGSPQTLVNFPKPLSVSLCPLDITSRSNLTETDFLARVQPLVDEGGPLAQWLSVVVGSLFAKLRGGIVATTNVDPISGALLENMHDPLCVWLGITGDDLPWTLRRGVDVRVECLGQWTRGCTVEDKRGRQKRDAADESDAGMWLVKNEGNRIDVAVESPAGHGPAFGRVLLDVIFSY